MNSSASLYVIIVSTVETNIACLESQSTITKIVLHSDERKSFLIKSIEIEF